MEDQRQLFHPTRKARVEEEPAGQQIVGGCSIKSLTKMTNHQSKSMKLYNDSNYNIESILFVRVLLDCICENIVKLAGRLLWPLLLLIWPLLLLGLLHLYSRPEEAVRPLPR
ncbi:hypothetical protein L3Y34_010825 [Caenorhabditis briggsae]|uniref:Uncharacterized protein n=1 Tax=Caenorhabditis briggsae TaxID=6238 RepID=A0AAE8ZUQ7_CAEBR|nr:hypothetical protein L3Y34_010825 [Caenorhabditis briggsae]